MNIDKKIFNLTIEIIFLVGLILFSNILWSSFNYENVAKIAYAYSNEKTLYIDTYKEKDNYNLKITNANKEAKKYNIYIKLNNNETNNDLSIENTFYILEDLKNFTKGNYTYYLIKEAKINKKTTDNMNIKTSIKNPEFKIEEI